MLAHAYDSFRRSVTKCLRVILIADVEHAVNNLRHQSLFVAVAAGAGIQDRRNIIRHEGLQYTRE